MGGFYTGKIIDQKPQVCRQSGRGVWATRDGDKEDWN